MSENDHVIDIVRAIHDYDSQGIIELNVESSILSFSKDSIIVVFQKDSSGWWDGSLTNSNVRGWFPSNFVEKIAPADVSVPLTTPTSNENPKYAKQTGELRLLMDETQHTNEGEKPLPRFWGKKITKEGKVYYFNSNTNQTTYDLALVYENEKPLSPKSEEELLRRNSSSKSAPRASITDGSFISNTQNVSWELLINNILRTISDLNQAAKKDSKMEYVSKSNNIVIAIRDMLVSANCVSRASPVLRKNKPLRSHHHQIMGSLSKLVLTSKVASGVWPPPDAINKMRYQAGQVLLCVRHFISLAQESEISLMPINESTSLADFDIKGAQLSDIEFVSRLDNHSEQIIKTISIFLLTIKELKKMIQIKNVQAASAQKILLIDQARQVVTEIGQFLSLVEELRIIASIKNMANLIKTFSQRKETLYTSVNDLVTIARSTIDPLGHPNALDKLLETTYQCEKCVEDLSSTVKLIVDQEQSLELHLLAQEADNFDANDSNRLSMMALNDASELNQLQRRAMSLTFSKSDVLEGIKAGSISIEDLYRENAKFIPKAKEKENSKGDISHNRTASMPPLPRTRSGGNADRKDGSNGVLAAPRTSEISFNMEGQVNGGTIEALVERLTLHDQPIDNGYLTAFLLTHTQFSSTEQVLDLLLKRFFLSPPDKISDADLKLWTEKKLVPIRLRVYNALKSLIETHWMCADLVLLEKLLDVTEKKMMLAMPSIATRLAEVIAKKVASSSGTTERRKKFVNVDASPSPILSKNYLGNLKKDNVQLFLLDFDPLEIARQLTILESRIFCEIGIHELINQEWTKKGSQIAVNVRKSTKISTAITGWVVHTILAEPDAKKRANLVKQIIKIGDVSLLIDTQKCLSLNNFSTLMSIVSALNSSPIDRLKKTWELISAKTSATFDTLRKATDLSRNYASYRQALKQCGLPCLPFLGLVLTDLTFTEDGNPKTRGSGLINFDKYSKTSRIITELQRFQLPYNLQPVVEIQDFLNKCLDGVDMNQDMYRISLKLEPREGGGPHSLSVSELPKSGSNSSIMLEDEVLELTISKLNSSKVGFTK